PAQGRGTALCRGRRCPRMQRGGGALARRGGDEEGEGGGAMNALEQLVGEARERLGAGAKRAGLIRVGYDVMDSPLGPLWIAVGPRGVVNIHYGATPDPRELTRITHAYGPGVVPDRRSCDRVFSELDQYFAGRRRSFDVEFDLAALTPF